MSGLTFTLPQGHPGTIVVATIHIVCPRHNDELIVDHCMTADGQTHVAELRGFDSEFVSAEQVATPKMPLLFVTMPVASVDRTDNTADVSHHRYRYACPRPTCNYDAQWRCDGDKGAWKVTGDALNGMRTAGVEAMTITNVESVWRVVPTS